MRWLAVVAVTRKNRKMNHEQLYCLVLSTARKQACLRLCDKIPKYLRALHFDFEEVCGKSRILTRWVIYYASMRIDFLSTGQVWDSSLSILSQCILKKDAPPVRQRPYRHSPVLAAKVKTEINKLVLAGISCRSYSNWTSPLVIIAKLTVVLG